MKKGFTLIELVAVIILIGLLGLIIYPKITGVINSNKQKLHDQQIEELKRHANTYASKNMDKLRTYENARNVVTFTDLYEAGIIQTDKIIDPLTDEEITGCMALIWKNDIKNFTIEFSDDCEKIEFTDESCFKYSINKRTGVLTITGYDRSCPMDVVIPEAIDDIPVTRIGAESFIGYDDDGNDYPDELLLTSVVIPDTVTYISSYAFSSNNITSLKLGNNVETIGQAFDENKLTSVVLPDSVKTLDGSFMNNNITEVTFSKSLTRIGSYTFYNNKLTSIVIPENVTSIDSNAFEYNQLTSVVFNKKLAYIYQDAFANNQLTSIELPDGLITIQMQAFYNNKLTSILIPNSVTTIAFGAFSNNQLTIATIGTGVTNIYNSSFSKSATSNPNLTKIINKSGKTFQWYSVTGCASDTTYFATGTLTCSPSDIEITSN